MNRVFHLYQHQMLSYMVFLYMHVCMEAHSVATYHIYITVQLV